MGKVDLRLTEREDLVPLCPHCGQPLEEVYIKQKGLGFVEARNVVYFCPRCLKVLGFGQSRMI